MADFVSNDTGSVLSVTCKDNQDVPVVIDLTGATVKLFWKDEDGVLQEKTMTVTAPLTGVATYKFLTTELAGESMDFEVEVTDVSGFILTSITLLSVNIRARLV